MGRVFANGSGDRVSIPGRVIPKTQKIVLDVALLNTQLYKVSIKNKVEQYQKTVGSPTIDGGTTKGSFFSVASFKVFFSHSLFLSPQCIKIISLGFYVGFTEKKLYYSDSNVEAVK